jgi:hypothetical protein
MRNAVARVPTGALLALIGVVSMCFMIGVGALARVLVAVPSGDSSLEAAASVEAPAPPESATTLVRPAPSLTRDEIETARGLGSPALLGLVEKHPRHAELRVALAQTLAKEQRLSAATDAVREALEIDPKQHESGKVAAVLFQAAQSSASTEAAFALLQGPMGSRGADVIFDLSQAKKVRREVRTRAKSWLESEAFQAASSPALNVAVALWLSKSCQQKYALLLRAKNVGDERSLAQVEVLKAKSGCGASKKSDCWPCLRNDSRLAEAIAAIQERSR